MKLVDFDNKAIIMQLNDTMVVIEVNNHKCRF